MPLSGARAPTPSAAGFISPPARTRGKRPLLLWAHLGWSGVAVIDATLFLFGVPALFTMLHRPCVTSADCIPAQLSLADYQALGGPGPALNAYMVYALVIMVGVALIWAAVGAVIAWRKWDDPMALFVSLTLMTYAPVTITFGASPTIAFGAATRIHVPEVLALSGPVISVVGSAVTELFYPTLGAFLLTFPTGRFAPRWSAIFVLIWILIDVLFFVKAPFAGIQLCLLTTFGGTAAIQVYRYARRYTPVQRQQTKWIVGAFAFVTLPLFVGYSVAPVFWPALNAPGSVFRLAGIAVLMLTSLPISLGIGIAILRYRLYDIDVIIRRTLIYGALTAILAALYFAVVLGVQFLGERITGQTSLPAWLIVATTLVIATLFTPLRHQVQRLVDRRFYRSRYDAARTLHAFAATLSGELDLPTLSDQLVRVVHETMQPAHVSLWLRIPSQQSASGSRDADGP